MEAFAQGVTGAKAALYQILYLQTPVISLPFIRITITFS